jgi:hypothetical protein
VFENRVLRRIFGPKRDEVTGEWRKVHNEELRDLYSSPSIIRIMKAKRVGWAGHVARMEEKRRTQGHSVVSKIRPTEKSNDLIGNQTHYLPACITVPQSINYPAAFPHLT